MYPCKSLHKHYTKTHGSAKAVEGQDFRLCMFSDADWAGDRSDRKSTSGNVARLYGGPVSWESRKQKSVATSRTESEYVSQTMCVKQALWIGQILRDMEFGNYIGDNPMLVNIKGDNQGAIALAKNPHILERSKHIDIKYHLIRDLIEAGQIAISYIPTNQMPADGLTKPLEKNLFSEFKRLIGLVER
ncbi:hypothetical protein K3495_g13146 [Podosphaera aphanis]|nr:hypothetical protein K3495_g13146 [Podosphaera aphanis]